MTHSAPRKPPLPIPDGDLFRAFDAIVAILRTQPVEARSHVAGLTPESARQLASALRSVLTDIETIHGDAA